MKNVIGLIAFFLHSTVLVEAQTLDPSFGTAGKAGPFLNGFTPSRYDKAMVVDANGAIVLAGSSGGRFAAMRLNANGTTDNNFGTNGLAEVNKPGIAADAVGIQSDGKIILVGYKATDQEFDNADIVVMRLNIDGTSDVSFGSNGVEIIDLSRDDRAHSVVVLPDDRILIAGYVNNGNDPNNASTDDFIVIRLNPFGSLDASFNTTGYRSIDFAGANDMARTLAVDVNGKILVGGRARVDEITNWDFAIARLNTDGSFDNGFSGDGKHTVSLTSSNDEVKSIVLQGDGNIILAGIGNSGFNSDYAVARLVGSDGSLDPSFDDDGKKLIDFNNALDEAGCVLIKEDGKIIVSGNTYNGVNDDFGIVCMDPGGILDNGFGTAGKYQLDFSNGNDLGNAMRLLADGKLLVGNNAGNNTGYHAGVFKLELPAATCNDADGDGYTTCEGDCDDANPAVNPAATEVCNNNLDDDCDGLTDDADPSVSGQTTWYADTDNDGYGDAASTLLACTQPENYVANDDDCNDTNGQIHPGATEVCNGIDDDCDATVDEGCPITVSINDASVNESDGIASLTVSLSRAADGPLKINYKTIDGTAVSGGRNKDYKGIGNSSLTIPAGETSAAIPIVIYSDNRAEGSEYFDIQITKAGVAQLGDNSGRVTILEGTSTFVTGNETGKIRPELPENLKVSAYPNPASHIFSIAVQTVLTGRIVMQVTDMLGRVIEVRNITANSIIEFGDKYRPGIYFIRITQGRQHKELKLVKL